MLMDYLFFKFLKLILIASILLVLKPEILNKSFFFFAIFFLKTTFKICLILDKLKNQLCIFLTILYKSYYENLALFFM